MSADAGASAAWQHDRMRAAEAVLGRDRLLDRRPLLDALHSVVREAVATGAPAAALLIDIDDFAEINAAWGPAAGDDVLAAIGARILEFAAARMGGVGGGNVPTVGRLDADHFVVLVPAVSSYEALRNTAAELLKHLAQPIALAADAVTPSARAAIVQAPAHATSVTSVLGRGFRLLNGAARVRPDVVAMSDPKSAEDGAGKALERDLAAALSTDQLFIALQPKVDVATGAVRGAEALARWLHPERGPVSPQAFIEAAETCGLIVELGLRILRDTCRISNKLAARGRGLDIAVNVSPHQLAEENFLARFLEVIDREGVSPQMLQIEVTESAAMMGGERIVNSLHSLRRCGIGVAIDDFGTGFSNLASLAALPADTLKIDRSLVTGRERGGKAGALLAIAVQLGQNFGMTTVAEGVETTEQFQHVTALGCDMVQGYFTGRPVKAAEFGDYYMRR